MNSSVIRATCPRQSVVPLPYSLSPWRRGGGGGGGEEGEEEGEGEGERRRGQVTNPYTSLAVREDTTRE